MSEILDEAANLYQELIDIEDDSVNQSREAAEAAQQELEQERQKRQPSTFITMILRLYLLTITARTADPRQFYLPPQGTGAATARLLADLEHVKESDYGRKFGYFAELCKDENTGLPDLYHWHVKLGPFQKEDNLYGELEQRGMDHVLLDLQFPFDYPNSPPFVRVIRPRFAFRTGHVTIGGSICMEVLTQTGWSPANGTHCYCSCSFCNNVLLDVETVIVQIRSEMDAGGAKLAHDDHSDYPESEAYAAYERVADFHNWKRPDWKSYRFGSR